jgi:hypothetical protein
VDVAHDSDPASFCIARECVLIFGVLLGEGRSVSHD